MNLKNELNQVGLCTNYGNRKPHIKVIERIRWLRLTKKERKAIKRYRKEKVNK